MTVLCKTRGRIGNGICPDVKVGGALCGMVGGTCAHEEIICSKCGGNMDKGKAIEQTYIGIPDFIGSDDVVTVIQLLRAKCNLQKQSLHPVDFMQKRGYLL